MCCGREGRELLLRNYTRGRRVHWSGFSSATTQREIAMDFAGPGGVLLRLDLLPIGSRARDICNFSAVRHEKEACLAHMRARSNARRCTHTQ